jgi:hypothetical protein
MMHCYKTAPVVLATANRECIIITQGRRTFVLIKTRDDNRTRYVHREITGDSGHEY